MGMTVVRVKDRGRDLAVHALEHEDEAREIAHIYVVLGYAAEKVILERLDSVHTEAA